MDILDEAIAAIELERELGIREFELSESAAVAVKTAAVDRPAPADSGMSVVVKSPTAAVPKPPADAPAPPPTVTYDFVFLHDRPLSPKAIEFMAKAVLGLKRTAETAPVVIVRDGQVLPDARIYVVLGQRALRVVAPEISAAVNTWTRDSAGRELFITFTPEYFLRFQVVTPAIEKLKREMWNGLKQVARKVEV